jgi:hypothetical protein
MSSHGAGARQVRSVRAISARRILIARILAVAADALQLWLFPVFGAGAPSVLDDGLDFVVAIALVLLVGWHLAFLPTFVVEMLPGVDLVPTWTIAVWFATRNRAVITDVRAAPKGRENA